MKKIILLLNITLFIQTITNSVVLSPLVILSKSKTKNVILKAEKRSITEGKLLPSFTLRTLDNKTVSDIDNKEMIKVFLFWQDDSKDLPKEFKKLARPLPQMIKDYETLNSKKVKVYSCFLYGEESFNEALPKRTQFKKTTFMISCLDWARNYLNLSLFKRVILTKNNKVILIKYINNNEEDFNFIRHVINTYK